MRADAGGSGDQRSLLLAIIGKRGEVEARRLVVDVDGVSAEDVDRAVA